MFAKIAIICSALVATELLHGVASAHIGQSAKHEDVQSNHGFGNETIDAHDASNSLSEVGDAHGNKQGSTNATVHPAPVTYAHAASVAVAHPAPIPYSRTAPIAATHHAPVANSNSSTVNHVAPINSNVTAAPDTNKNVTSLLTANLPRYVNLNMLGTYNFVFIKAYLNGSSVVD